MIYATSQAFCEVVQLTLIGGSPHLLQFLKINGFSCLKIFENKHAGSYALPVRNLQEQPQPIM